jgi:hypothetical protein
MNAKHVPVLFAVVVMLASANVALPQGYNMQLFTLGGGGRSVSGSGYSLSGTVGQPNTANLSGGSFALRAGFWSIIESSGAPQLRITRSNAEITVSWPLSTKGYNLEQTSTPSPLSNSWAAISPPYTSNTTSFSFRINPPSRQMFFRLHKP